MTDPIEDPKFCVCCGSRKFVFSPSLWPELVAEWEISEYEVAYINRQQFFKCQTCGCNLRSMALGKAIMQCYRYNGLFRGFVKSFQARRLHTLELNTAGDLTHFLARLPKRTLACYPDVDMMCLPYKNESYDLVVHSETLEHVPDPVKALAECHRVLRPGGFCCFTIPVIVDRPTRSRQGLPPSYHGNNADTVLTDYLVQTEYGSDAWKDVVRAGFNEVRMYWIEYPSAHALVGIKSS